MDAALEQSEEISLRSSLHRRNLRLRLYVFLIAADCLAILLGFTVANMARDRQWLTPGGVNLATTILPIYLILAFNSHAYSRAALTSGWMSLRRSLTPLAITSFTILTVIFFVQVSTEVSRLGFAVSVAATALFMILFRLSIVVVVRRTVAPSLVAELLIVDDRDRLEWTGPKLSDTIFTVEAGIKPDVNDPYMLHRLATILSKYERVVVRCSPDKQADWSLLLRGANVTGEILVAGFGDVGVIGLQKFKGRTTLLVAEGPLSYTNMAKKRALDLLLTVPAVIALAPVLAIIAIAVKLDSPGSVLFRQERIGRGNRIFHILKFRSMRADSSDARGATSASRDDHRITRVGRFIRKTSLDELPQLLNVMLGDMSLVGPRPHALGSLAGDRLFWEIDREYWHRHALKPGITGLAQVRGFRGATHRDVDLKNRLQADLEYLHDWSLMRDIAILFLTVKVLVHRNAY